MFFLFKFQAIYLFKLCHGLEGTVQRLCHALRPEALPRRPGAGPGGPGRPPRLRGPRLTGKMWLNMTKLIEHVTTYDKM